MSGALLRLRAVEKSYRLPGGEVAAIRDLDFDLDAGEFVTVTGPSGSGKSTLLNLATLLDSPTRGALHFDGRDATSLGESGRAELRKRSIGVIFQNYHLLADRSVLDNVLFRFRYLDVPSGTARRAAQDALERTGLTPLAQRPARLLSGGEMQRTAIARAIAVAPRLLAADEPTGNLDAASADGVMQCLSELNRGGTAVLLVTHDIGLLRYGGRHVCFRHGSLEQAHALH